MIRWTTFFVATVAILVFVALPGCNTGNKKADADKAKEKDKDKEKGHDHGETGPHGGPIVEWEPYHAEFTVDHDAKLAVIYILDDTVKKAAKVDPADISKVKLTILSEKPNITIDLVHDAKKSGPEGIAYTGTHDFFAKPGAFKGNLSGHLPDEKTKKAKPFTGDFDYAPKKEGGEKKKSASASDLFLKPGGIYTFADIKANGNMLPAEKFKGKTWAHDDNLKVGDKICPVTKNKAEAECAWTVQSQRYEFCCPPCLDKFMRWAHNEPEKVKDAKEYVQKDS